MADAPSAGPGDEPAVSGAAPPAVPVRAGGSPAPPAASHVPTAASHVPPGVRATASPVPPAVRQPRDAVLAWLSDPAAAARPLAVPSAALTPGPRTGTPHEPAQPGDRRLARVAIPAAALAGVAVAALVAVLVAMLAGWTGVAAAVTAVVLAAVAGGLAGLSVHAGILGGTARRTPARWESSRPWIGPLGTSPGRRLVELASRAAERIAGCPAWWEPGMDDHRLTLDLAAELDQIDGQAYALATRDARPDAARPAVTSSQTDRADPEWAALVDHVTALVDYADLLERFCAGSGPAQSPAGGPLPQQPELGADTTAAGAARDEFATTHLRRLATDLTSRTTS